MLRSYLPRAGSIAIALSALSACSSGGSDSGAPVDGGGAAPDGATSLPDAGPSAGDAASAADSQPSLPTVHFIGRFDTSDPAGPRFEWPASAMRVRFAGSEIAVTLKDVGNQYAVIVDGQPGIVLKTATGTSTYPLATGLAEGTHDLLLYRRTEALFGAAQLLAFTPKPPGALLAADFPSARQIEIIGDSISCGYGDEGASATCSFSADTENEYLSYGALTARALGAEQRTIAWSGKGVFRNYDGSTTETMPSLFTRTLPTEAASHWSFTAPAPDVVVVNLGTNDFAKGDPGQPFVTAYESFLRDLRTAYPAATFFCALGPMLVDPHLSIARGYVQKVVSDATAGGDAKVHFIELAPQNAAVDGEGCDSHPSLATHAKMATALTAAIRSALAW